MISILIKIVGEKRIFCSLICSTRGIHENLYTLNQNDFKVLLFYTGSLLDTFDHFNTSKRSDYNTLKATFDSVIKSHYPAAKGHVALRLVPCPQICAEAMSVLSR